ncbi:Cyclomaltodextrin glucanotransferase [Paenibacillus algicola]|uniref:Cyclomaltodextrin glucanotransferase n=1 Tax=Paenibacillus algicola TaxID=2565926 RepID=A0A4P8XH09_9BACL|nr:alpha-amylase family glycosyl hydrolase [Paenibacillus algicola]QCT01443.1 Cyclomaltodextrin glucanotransferase [Paenibacillus algicola]
MKRWTRFTAAFTLSLSLALSVITPAQAAPDTSVTNKQNFSTDVIYQIFTDRFSDGNAANNPSGSAYSANCSNLRLYCGGDWQGIINKINDGYLTGMGITAIWISQPVENIYSVINYSGVNNTAYHGYWARDFKKANPYYGTMTEFSNLISAAHAKNIKVIIDFAPNHTSPASSDQPSFAENGKLYNNGTLLGGYTNDTQNLFHHNGGTNFSSTEDGIYRNLYDLADLNHNNSTVDKYLKDAIKMWLDLGIDGIRVDAVKHMPFGWQKSFMATINNYKPVFTFGEWFLGTNEVSAENHQFANEIGMSLLDFRFAQKTRQVFRDGTDNMYGLKAMLEGTAVDYAQVDDQVTFIDNHDMERFQTGSNRKLEQALAFTLTSRGVPAIYYGTEQYMAGGNDPNNRARIPSFSTTTTAYNVIKKLAPLRKSNPAIAYGSTQERWINNDVIVYERKFGSSTAVIAINRNLNTSASISGMITSLPAGTYSDALGGLLGGGSMTAGGSGTVNAFTLAAGAVAVWEKTSAQSTPVVGHVGPMMAKAGTTITIDGRGFGAAKGTVYFGTTAVTGSAITSWEDTQIKVKIPAVTPGKYNVRIGNAGAVQSNVYDNFEVLTGDQVTVRFIVNNATTTLGQNVYLAGSVSELGNWDPAKAIGPLYNKVITQYPTWYYDVSVPAGATISYKFLKKSGSTATWEGGSNRTFTAPASGTATVNVNWQP